MMNEKEKEFIKRINIDKAKKKLLYCIGLMIVSLLTYIEPLLYGNFDFGFVFELTALICIFIAISGMNSYNEKRSEKFTILSMIPIGWLFIYDFITLMSEIVSVLDIAVLSIYVILAEALMISILVLLFKAVKDIRKASNPEENKESMDWFYERLNKENKTGEK